MLSTSAAENQTLQPVHDAVANAQAGINDDAMEVDIMHDDEMSSPLSDARSDADVIPNAKPPEDVVPTSKIVYAPDGTIIVETLDTPALRREKALRRKAERLRLAAEVEAAASLSSAGPSQLTVSQTRSDSSSLTDLEENEEGKTTQSESRPNTSAAPKDPAAVVLADGEMLEGGTLGTFWLACIHSILNDFLISVGESP